MSTGSLGIHHPSAAPNSDRSIAGSEQIDAVVAASRNQALSGKPFLRPRYSSSVSTPKQSENVAQHTLTSVGLSELEWIKLLNPKISTRNGQFPFYWRRAVEQFLVHLFHPFSSPFLYLYIWARKGREQADMWVLNHSFQLPSLSRPLFSSFNIQRNMTGVFFFLLYNIFIHVVAIIPMALAFLRVYNLPTAMESNISQDYTHEAYFLFILRAAWCSVVGIKHGFYSKSLANHLQNQVVDASLTSSEQILANWCPDLGRLMFELHVVTAHFPCFRSFHFSISKNHPVVSYLQRCKHVHDPPLCNLKPTVISQVLAALPENNFHKLFWNKTPSVIGSSVNDAAAELLSFSKYTQGVDTSEFNLNCFGAPAAHSSSNANSEPLNSTATSNSAVPGTSGSSHFSAPEADHLLNTPDAQHSNGKSSVTAIGLKGSLSSATVKVNGASPNAPASTQSTSEAAPHPSKYQDVPAFILMAYAVSRASSVGSTWVRPSFFQSRVYRIALFLAASFYAVPGVMRLSQVTFSVQCVGHVLHTCHSSFSLQKQDS